MPNTDPIADFLTQIRNAARARHAQLELPTSNMKVRLAEILKREGYIADFRPVPMKPQGRLRILLRYRANGEPMIREIRRLSRPGCRWYASVDEIPGSATSISTTVLSTSRGIMTDREAREARIGGELIFRVQ